MIFGKIRKDVILNLYIFCMCAYFILAEEKFRSRKTLRISIMKSGTERVIPTIFRGFRFRRKRVSWRLLMHIVFEMQIVFGIFL